MIPLPAVIHWTSPEASSRDAHAVTVVDGSGEDVRDRLNTSVRMPGKARQIVLPERHAKIVERRNGSNRRVAEPNARVMHSRASSVGLDLIRRFTGRMDMGTPCSGSLLHEWRPWQNQSRKRPTFP